MSNHYSVDIPLHGGLFHSTCIMICKYICWKRGYELKNPVGFSTMNKCPGIPDIYIAYQYKGKDDYGKTRTFRKNVCIEIETDATPANILKKNEQFTRPGTDPPIIIDMGKGFDEYKSRMKAKGIDQPNDIEWIAQYIESRLVL